LSERTSSARPFACSPFVCCAANEQRPSAGDAVVVGGSGRKYATLPSLCSAAAGAAVAAAATLYNELLQPSFISLRHFNALRRQTVW
jgi:hypothetical protein